MSSKKKSVAVEKPVTERGVDLLKRIYAEDGMFLTQDEALDIVQAGFAEVDNNNVGKREGTAYVHLTDAGEKEIGVTKPVVSAYAISADIPPPAKTRKPGRSGSKYPFDKLEVGQSFHVSATAAVPDPFAAIASSVTGARRRYSEPTGEMETVTVKTFEMENGKRVKREGHYVVTGSSQVEQEKRRQVRDFMAAAVGADDPNGAGARIWRVL